MTAAGHAVFLTLRLSMGDRPITRFAGPILFGPHIEQAIEELETPNENAL